MAVAFALASSSALAQDSGGYIGLGYGLASARDACDGVPAGIRCDDEDAAVKLLAGYRFNRNFALEAAYSELGEARFSGPGGTVDFESSAFEIVAVGIAPLGPQWWLYGKAGVFFWNLDVSLVDRRESGTELTYGLGVGVDLFQSAALRIEYQAYPDIGDDATTGTSDVTVLGVNLIVRF